MGTAQEILVVYAASSIAFGMLLGVPLTRIRMGAPSAPHHLVVATFRRSSKAPSTSGLRSA